jgi:hypothetical protein
MVENKWSIVTSDTQRVFVWTISENTGAYQTEFALHAQSVHHSQTKAMNTRTHASPPSPIDGIAVFSENARGTMSTRITIDAATAVTAAVTVSPIVAAVDK